MSAAQQRQLVQVADPADSSVTARCQALGLAKGVRGLRDHLRPAGYLVNEKRVRRLVRLVGHEPVYPKPRLSVPGQGVTP